MKLLRAIIVHLLYNGYYCMLCWRLYAALEISSEFSKEGTIAAAVVICIAFTVVQILSVFFSFTQRYKVFS